MLKSLIAVGVGGFIGAVLRYLIYLLTLNISTLPAYKSTLIVNLVGSLILGAIIGAVEAGISIKGDIYLFLTIGVCGGFTTYSTFSNELFNLLNNRAWGHLTVYLLLSLVGSVALIWLGRLIFIK